MSSVSETTAVSELRKKGAILYLTNHFTHPVFEAQMASPRHHLARALAKNALRLIVFSPLGRHVGSPLRDFITNLRPKLLQDGHIRILFPPLLKPPGQIGTGFAMVQGTFFLMLYLAITRPKVSCQYATTILTAASGAIMRKFFGLPLVANYGDPDHVREFGVARKIFWFFESLVFNRKNASRAVYVDPVLGDYLRRVFPMVSLRFLPNGGYESGYHPPTIDSQEVGALKLKYRLEGCPVILYAGQVEPFPYRLDLLVKAAPKILEQFPNVRFMIIGSGSFLPELASMVRKAGLANSFIFTGPVPYNKIGSYVVLADITLQLLRDMCMGTKVILYMVHRKPVISTGSWHNKYNEFLVNGKNCILIPPEVDALTNTIISLLKDAKLRRRIGEEGWLTVKPYSWDAHALVTTELMLQTLEQQGGSV